LVKNKVSNVIFEQENKIDFCQKLAIILFSVVILKRAEHFLFTIPTQVPVRTNFLPETTKLTVKAFLLFLKATS